MKLCETQKSKRSRQRLDLEHHHSTCEFFLKKKTKERVEITLFERLVIAMVYFRLQRLLVTVLKMIEADRNEEVADRSQIRSITKV